MIAIGSASGDMQEKVQLGGRQQVEGVAHEPLRSCQVRMMTRARLSPWRISSRVGR